MLLARGDADAVLRRPGGEGHDGRAFRRICSGDLAAYLASLERVLALEPARLLPAHGPVIDDPERVLRGYIEHRREREQQILDALRVG